jgi:hypothetical protein
MHRALDFKHVVRQNWSRSLSTRIRDQHEKPDRRLSPFHRFRGAGRAIYLRMASRFHQSIPMSVPSDSIWDSGKTTRWSAAVLPGTRTIRRQTAVRQGNSRCRPARLAKQAAEPDLTVQHAQRNRKNRNRRFSRDAFGCRAEQSTFDIFGGQLPL